MEAEPRVGDSALRLDGSCLPTQKSIHRLWLWPGSRPLVVTAEEHNLGCQLTYPEAGPGGGSTGKDEASARTEQACLVPGKDLRKARYGDSQESTVLFLGST